MIIKEWKVLYTVIIIPDWCFFLSFVLQYAFAFKPFLHVVAMIASLELQVPKLGGSCLTLFLGPLIFCSQQFTSKAAGICHHWEGSAVLSLFFLFCACTHTPCSMGFKVASEKDTIIFF